MSIRLHGNGFIQLDIAENQRLHIWSEDLPPAQNVRTPIHDHTFDFVSQVLCGELHHIEYDWLPDVAPTHGLLRAEPTMTEDTKLVPILEDGVVCLGEMLRTRQLDVKPGQRYAFNAGQFHETTATGLTATMFWKTRTGLLPYARIACGIFDEPDNEFSRYQWSESDLWPFVARVLGEIGPDISRPILDALTNVLVSA